MRSIPQGLCTDGAGQFDAHKFWYHVACFTATVVFAKIGWYATPSDSLSGLFLVYLGAVGGSQLAQIFLQGKYGNGGQNATTQQPAKQG